MAGQRVGTLNEIGSTLCSLSAKTSHLVQAKADPLVCRTQLIGWRLAVSSSPRPWIDVSALPEKFNMAVTESDLSAGCELSMRACNWNVTDSEKNIFDLNIQGQVLDMTAQRNVPRFCTGSICDWNLLHPLGLVEDETFMLLCKV